MTMMITKSKTSFVARIDQSPADSVLNSTNDSHCTNTYRRIGKNVVLMMRPSLCGSKCVAR